MREPATRAREGDPRIARIDLARAMAQRLGTETQDQLRAFRGYANGSRLPESHSAWHLGEALRSAGVPWCSGLWMLWLCGHYDDAVGTVATWIRPIRLGDRNELCAEIWDMFRSAGSLWRSTALDATPEFLYLYVRKSGDDDETDKVLSRWEQAAFATGTPRHIIDLTKADFIGRETAKYAWSAYDEIAEPIESAFRQWKAEGFREKTELDSMVTSMIAIANAPQITAVEMALQAMLASWLYAAQGGFTTVWTPPGTALSRASIAEDREAVDATIRRVYIRGSDA